MSKYTHEIIEPNHDPDSFSRPGGTESNIIRILGDLHVKRIRLEATLYNYRSKSFLDPKLRDFWWYADQCGSLGRVNGRIEAMEQQLLYEQNVRIWNSTDTDDKVARLDDETGEMKF